MQTFGEWLDAGRQFGRFDAQGAGELADGGWPRLMCATFETQHGRGAHPSALGEFGLGERVLQTQGPHALAQDILRNSHTTSIIVADDKQAEYSIGTSEAARSDNYGRPLDQHLKEAGIGPMTTLSVSTRADRAEQLVERRTEWLPVQAHDGRTGVAMPSQRKAGLFHLTDGYTCSCPDYVY